MTLDLRHAQGACLAAVIFCILWSSSANAGSTPAFGFSGGLEYFQLEEVDGTGARLLKESGPRYLISGHLDNSAGYDTAVRWLYHTEVAAYAGSVDYDGQSQSVDPAQGNQPFASNTDYYGLRGEALLGYRRQPFSLPLGVEILGGAGLDVWLRRIQGGLDANGAAINGAEELYRVYYGKIALGLTTLFSSTWHGYLQTGLKMPLSISEDVNLSAAGFDSDVTLSPGNAPWGYIKLVIEPRSASNKPGNLLFAVYYDGFRFNRSEAENVTHNGTPIQVLQPETHIDIVGAQIGYRF